VIRVLRVGFLSAVLCALVACAGGPKVTATRAGTSAQDLLSPYKILAARVPAVVKPAVDRPLDLSRSVQVPSAIAQAVLGTRSPVRVADDSTIQEYALVAFSESSRAASGRRQVREDGDTCYFLVTYMYNVHTGEVVAILGVTFEGCSSGDAGDSGGGAGSGSGSPSPANTGCPGSRDQTAGKAYAQIGGTNPVFNDPPANSNGQEMYGYIYQNGNQFAFDSPTTLNLTSGNDAGIPPPAEFPDWTPVGLYHTHPHHSDVDPTQVDVRTGNHFSPTDVATATEAGYPIYVAVLDTLSSNSSETPVVRWYKYDPTTGKETIMNLVGSGGC
jgi:hypothetical protein